MVDVVEQLCIKSCWIKAQNSDEFTAKQGKKYTTTVPTIDSDKITLFSTYWVSVPKDHFVLVE